MTEGDPAVAGHEQLIEDLRPSGVERSLAAGETLCREGEESTGAFIVMKGRLEAVVDIDGVEMIVAEHGPGALVGEVTTVVGGPRTATLRPTEPTVVSVVSKAELSGWLDAHPDHARTVLDLARERTDRNRAAVMLSEYLGIDDRALAVAMADRLVIESEVSGTELIRAGATPTAAGLLISGRVVVTDLGGEQVEHSRGHVVGLEGLFDEPSRATVRTTRDSTVGWLTRDDFASLVTGHPLPVVKLVRRMASPRRSPLRRRGRSVAVLTPGGDSAEVVTAMAAAIGPGASVLLLDPEVVDALLGSDGVARRGPDEPGNRRVEELLHQVEVDHDVVLLHASIGDGGWLDRVVRHADHILVWSDGPPTRAIEALVAEARQPGVAAPIWLAIRHGAGADLPHRTGVLRSRLGVDEIHHARTGQVGDVERIGRLATGYGVGLVLSGGGGRGFAHIGAIRSFRERGIPIDRVAGASMGAVIGGTVALGYEGEALIALVERQFRRLLDYTVPLVSVLKGERIAASIVETFGETDIEDTWIPFSCVTTNLTRNRSEVHRSGSLAHAVRASVAIPGILPPVPLGEDLLIDGGVLDNLPLGLMTDDRSIGTVVAVDVAPLRGPRAKDDFGLSVSGWSAVRDRVARSKNRLPTLGSVLMRSMTVGSARQRDERLATGAADLYLYLDLAGVGLLDFERVREVAERGYRAADPEIADWAATADRAAGEDVGAWPGADRSAGGSPIGD